MEQALRKAKQFIPRTLFWWLQWPYHFLLALLAALWYRFPSRHLTVIGVTGTKGKTTVVHLAHEVMQASGAKTASLSSVRFKIGDREEPNLSKMTMPGRFFVQRFLRRAVREKCAYAVIEVTSQGIAQSRHRFIRFQAAVMTNMAPEHIESHGSFERYLRAKLDLFWRLGTRAAAVINRDDPHSKRFAAATREHRVWYDKDTIELDGKIWKVLHANAGPDGIAFNINGKTFTSPLSGTFNLYNILAAVATGLSQHVELHKIATAIAHVAGVPGRMEMLQREPFRVVVDYAHTPESLRSVYETLRLPDARMICVLGAAGGGRDTWKRPEFGKIAAEFCTETFLTNEDPYDENPMAIIDEIAVGFSDSATTRQMADNLPAYPAGRQPTTLHKILDRRDAIRTALRSAGAGDIVVITGKGSESWLMGPNGSKIAWDDRAVVREELQNLTTK